ncbi:methyltransferase [Endozoicomonas montiporae]|uniref:Methyltransferase small domain-containing protein n=1 Tax=Endozoicomonas montiporae CL-33 TaxID=570277 RepID=A0A142BCI0_9GAMM|nr:class I SAM-dependent methyltransferase [Endozoicomonas montiporae]AMO56456.1 hypothetical protein EZMO1_2361 [Endozoicomonas montiporae CL-33]
MTETEWITWLLTGLAFLATGSIVLWSLKLGITPTPTSRTVQKTMERLLPKSVEGHIYELGCGWGTLLLMLSKHYPNHRITGYEQSTIPYLFAKAVTSHKTNITVKKKDFFNTRLDDAGLVTCYLFPGGMKRLDPFLKQQLPGKCPVISHTFALPGWNKIEKIKAEDLYRTSVFVYRKENEVVSPTGISPTGKAG